MNQLGLEHVRQPSRVGEAFDSVYFLMYDGWENELQSNRWHYSRRWAKQLPVVLLQPRQRDPELRQSQPTPGVPNCEILYIAEATVEASYARRSMIQTAQVMDHMRLRGHRRPLLWSYNPRLVGLYAATPAAGRVHHATENYFDFEGMSGFFRRELEATLALSDLVIPVSSGVESGILRNRPNTKTALVTNGCDTSHYHPGGERDPELIAAGARYERVAIFAGNINARLDFGLIERIATTNSKLLIALVGPVTGLDDEKKQQWRRLRGNKNILHLEAVDATRLPSLYRAADVGLIPYRRDPWLVRNGFPLKTLEMAATGLPVVASHMEPIDGLAKAVVVTRTDGEFVTALEKLSKDSLSPSDQAELEAVCAANDYDRKFEQALTAILTTVSTDRRRTGIDELFVHLGNEPWLSACMEVLATSTPGRTSMPLTRRATAAIYSFVGNALPSGVRRRLPSSLRARARRMLTI